MRTVPGLSRWKKERKEGLLLMLAIMFCPFLICFLFILSDSMKAGRQEKRFQAYGAWQCAMDHLTQKDEDYLRTIPYLKEAGALWTYGSVESGTAKDSYLIGGMDQEAAVLARISLVEGRLPEKTGEAAVEATLLTTLGLPLKAGQSISIQVRPYAAGGSTGREPLPGGEGESLDITLTVSGILKDYTYGWAISDRVDLPGILISEETAAAWNLEMPTSPEGVLMGRLLLLRGQDGWNSMEEDLGSLILEADRLNTETAKRRHVYFNSFAYPSGAEDALTVVMDSLTKTGMLMGLIILLLAVWYSVRNRRQEWRQLYLLGAPVGLIRKQLWTECLVFGAVSVAWGGLMSVPVSGAVLAAAGKWTGSEMPLRLEIPHLGTGIGVTAVMLAAVYALPVIRMRHDIVPTETAARYSREKTAGFGRFRWHRKTRKSISLAGIWRREWADKPLFLVAEVLLLSAALILPCFGLERIHSQNQLLNRRIQMGMTGYRIEPDQPQRKDAGIPADDVERLKQIYGVGHVTAFHQNTTLEDWFLALSDWPENLWLDRMASCLKNFWTQQKELLEGDAAVSDREIRRLETLLEELDQNHIRVNLFTTDDDRFWNCVERNLDGGRADREDILAGETGVLLVPDLMIYPDGTFYHATNTENIPSGAGIEQIAWQKEELPDSPIHVEADGRKIPVQISGYIRDLENRDVGLFHSMLGTDGITLLAGHAFFEKLWQDEKFPTRYVQSVTAEATWEADPVTDRQIQRIVKGHNALLQNDREDFGKIRQELWSRVGYYGVICSLGSIICFMILYVLLQSQKAYRKERQYLLQSLGIPQSWSRIIQMSEVLAPALLTGILSPLALSWFFTYEDNRRLALAGSSMVLPFRLRLGIPAIWYAGVLLTVLAVSCGVAMADPDRGDGT